VDEVDEVLAYCDNTWHDPTDPMEKPICGGERRFVKDNINSWLCGGCGNGHTIADLIESVTTRFKDDKSKVWPIVTKLKLHLIQAVMFDLQQTYSKDTDPEYIFEIASLIKDILPGDDFKELADYIVEWRERKGFHTPSKMGKCNHKKAQRIPQVGAPVFRADPGPIPSHWCPDCGAIKMVSREEEDRWKLPNNPSSPGDALLGKLMLVATEVAEMAEAVRHEDEANFKEEMADTFIRLLDMCGTMGIDIKQEIKKKMEINESRPIRHGKKTRL
jgi:NTP pyrophosphatase (non-canonical NTP hydrolase)